MFRWIMRPARAVQPKVSVRGDRLGPLWSAGCGVDELFVDLDLAQDAAAAADAVSRELFGRWSVSWQTGQGMVPQRQARFA